MYHRLLSIALLCLFCLSAKAVSAQKKKGGKLSDAERYQAERLFIEGERHYILEDYAKAYQAYQESLEVDPGNATCHYKIAEILVENGNWDKALFHALQAMELAPTNAWYYELTAKIYKRQTNFKRAAAVYKQLIDRVEASEENYHALAEMYLYLRDYSEALATYEEAEERLGVRESILVKKQAIYSSQNQIDKALRVGEALIEAFPGETSYRLAQAQLLQSNGMQQQAVETLRQAHEVDPKSEEVELMLADIFMQAEDWEQAAPYLRSTFRSQQINMEAKVQIVGQLIVEGYLETQAELIGDLVNAMLLIDGQNAKVLAIKGDVLFAQGKKEEAISAYLESTRYDGGNFIVWQNILRMEFEMARFADAAKHSEQALEYFPNQGILYFLNGTANFNIGELELAIGALQQSKRLTRNNQMLGDILAQLGDAYYQTGQPEESFAAYEEALGLNPDNDHVLNNYSYYLSLAKTNLDKARQMSLILVRKYPDNATYLDTHGWVLYQQENYQEALNYIQKAVDEGDASAEVYDHLGDVLYQLNRVDDAVNYWQKAQALDASIEGIDQKIADRKLYED